MNPRQPIKTTAKKIGSFQNKIGKNPNRSLVDLRPYGGYSPLAHKIEAGSHIEQNYSVNVQNQMQLLKKISESTTLNTSHMHMQLGQLEKEFKEWERKVGKVVKKKDRPLADGMPNPLSHKSFSQRIKATEGRFSHYGQIDIGGPNFWVEKLHDTYMEVLKNESIDLSDTTGWQAAYLYHIKTLETSVKPLLTSGWHKETSRLIEHLASHLDRVDEPVVTSKSFYKALKKETALDKSSLDSIRSHYKSKEKHSGRQWSDKEKHLVVQLDTILADFLTKERKQRVETDYKGLVQTEPVSKEVYETLEAYYKTFEQNHWMKTLILAESPLMGEDMHKGVALLYDYFKFLSSNANNLKRKATVTTLYELLYGRITETIDKQDKALKLDKLIKEQVHFLGSNSRTKNLSEDKMNRLLKYLFVVNQQKKLAMEENLETLHEAYQNRKEERHISVDALISSQALKEIFSNRETSELVSILETMEGSGTITVIENKQDGFLSTRSELNPINMAVLKSAYEKFYEAMNTGIEQTLTWMVQTLSIKKILVRQTLSDARLDVERHFHDVINVSDNIFDATFEEIEAGDVAYTGDSYNQHKSNRGNPFYEIIRFNKGVQRNIGRRQQWVRNLTGHYGQNGFGVFKVKQFFNQSTLTYNQQALKDEFVRNQFSTLHKFVETLSSQLKTLSETLSLKEAYETVEVERLLKRINREIGRLIRYDKKHYYVSEVGHKERAHSFIEEKMMILRQSIGGKDLIYKEGLIEAIESRRQELEVLTRTFERNDHEQRIFRESYLERQLKETQHTVANKHLAFSSKHMSRSGDMQVYYMTNGNTMYYGTTAMSYEDIMNQVHATALKGFSQIHKEIKVQKKTELASNSVQNNLNKSTSYTAKHIHESIQKLSQNLQQLLGHDSHILNQRQLMTYSQLLFGENGVEAVTEKLVRFVEKQYLKTLGFEPSSITAYMNSSNQQVKRMQLTQSSRAYINHFEQNSWIRHQWLSPWSIQILNANKYRNSRVGDLTHPMLYALANRSLAYNSNQSERNLQQFVPQTLHNQKWAEWIVNRGELFREYAYTGIDQLYTKLIESQTFLESSKGLVQGENSRDNHYQYSTYAMVHKNQESNQSPKDDINRYTNMYNDTLIAYTTEAVEASSEDLTKELLTQKEVIESLQSELAVLKEEKEVGALNIDKLSDTLLKELSHRIRKDRQRKGWI